MEAVVKEARTARHPWSVACDANMNSEDLKKNLWFRDRCTFTKALEEVISTCQCKAPHGELRENV